MICNIERIWFNPAKCRFLISTLFCLFEFVVFWGDFGCCGFLGFGGVGFLFLFFLPGKTLLLNET